MDSSRAVCSKKVEQLDSAVADFKLAVPLLRQSFSDLDGEEALLNPNHRSHASGTTP